MMDQTWDKACGVGSPKVAKMCMSVPVSSHLLAGIRTPARKQQFIWLAFLDHREPDKGQKKRRGELRLKTRFEMLSFQGPHGPQQLFIFLLAKLDLEVPNPVYECWIGFWPSIFSSLLDIIYFMNTSSSDRFPFKPKKEK